MCPVLRRLIRRAAEAPPGAIEEYARKPSFQVLNFLVGYLPSLVLILAVVIGVEYLVMRIVERWRAEA
jgi:flagellar biogenesis protein FliO